MYGQGQVISAFPGVTFDEFAGSAHRDALLLQFTGQRPHKVKNSTGGIMTLTEILKIPADEHKVACRTRDPAGIRVGVERVASPGVIRETQANVGAQLPVA